jgi:dUTP pyrophosphatase
MYHHNDIEWNDRAKMWEYRPEESTNGPNQQPNPPHNNKLFDHHYGCGYNVHYWPITPVNILSLGVKKLHSNAIIPSKGTEHAAAFDLYTIENTTVRTGKTVKIKTGIALEIPTGYFGLIKDRSSLASKGIITVGGVIDSDYRGEIIVCQTLTKTARHYDVNDDELLAPDLWEYSAGDKIAQLLILPVPNITIYDVGEGELTKTERNDKGFGSTGK